MASEFESGIKLLAKQMALALELTPNADEALIVANWDQVKDRINEILAEIGDIVEQIG